MEQWREIDIRCVETSCVVVSLCFGSQLLRLPVAVPSAGGTLPSKRADSSMLASMTSMGLFGLGPRHITLTPVSFFIVPFSLLYPPHIPHTTTSPPETNTHCCTSHSTGSRNTTSLNTTTHTTAQHASHILHAPVARADCLADPEPTSTFVLDQGWSSVRQGQPGYVPSFDTTIVNSKDSPLTAPSL